MGLQEDGQCGFFQWQDQPPRKQQIQGAFDVGEQHTPNPEADSTLQAPQTPQCRCGLEAVEITSNSAANPGRAFYKCPKNEVSYGWCVMERHRPDTMFSTHTAAE